MTFESCRRSRFLKCSRVCRLLPKTNNIFQFHIFIVRPTLTNLVCSPADSETLFVCKNVEYENYFVLFHKSIEAIMCLLEIHLSTFLFYLCVIKSLFGITYIQYYIRGYGYILLDSRTFSYVIAFP